MISGFFKGVTSYFTALSFVQRHNLHKYFLLSGLVSLLIGLGLAAIVYYAVAFLGGTLVGFVGPNWGGGYLQMIIPYLIGAMFLVVGFLIFKYLLLICVGPLMGPLSEKVESIVLHEGRDISQKLSLKSTSYSIARGIRFSLRNASREIMITIVLLCLGLIPLLTPFITPLIFLVQAYYLGAGNMDYFLERHYRYKESIQEIRKNKGLAMGNGTGFILLLMIPVLGLFLAPVLGTVAASLKLMDQ